MSGSKMNQLTPVGLDLGNRRVKVCIDNLYASIPALYAFDKPTVLGKSGQEIKAKCFSLLFRIDKSKSVSLWFGQDVLGSQSTIQEIDEGKYTKSYIQRMFQAVLYQWSIQHKRDLSQLGKLNICASMPPGSYQKPAARKRAEKAYRAAFNTGQSHMKIRPTRGEAIQVVTQFHSLVREAVVWGGDLPRRNELILTVDLGGGTDDIVLFNGSPEPIDSRTYKNGLIHTYHKINSSNPSQVELRIMKDKSYFPNELMSYYNQKKLMIQMVNRALPRPVDRIYIIGGGAALMPKVIKNSFSQLAGKVIIKDQYANAQANWKEASK
jgi:hypothetical protein